VTLAARRAPRVAPLLLGLALASAAPRLGLAGEEPTHVEKGGVAIDFSIDRPGGGDRPLQEGDHVEVRFRMTDLATGRPLTGVKPAAWLDIGSVIQDQAGGQRECKDKIGLYLKGIVGIRPMVDLNSSYLLVLNQDPSLSVIDPVVSMTGRTSLYATVILKRPPADWVLGAESKRLYVSMPQADEVAVVDAENFKLEASLEAGRHPVRVALQAEAGLLWVGNDAEAPAESGVTVLDLRSSKRLAHLATGRGHHELAFSADGRHAFVSNRDAGTVSVIEVAHLRKVKDLATGPVPISLAVSSLSGALYVADGKTGEIAVVDPAKLAIVARVPARPGLGPLRISQDGRWAFAVNPAENAVYVLDTTGHRLTHTIPVGGKPYQVTFTRAFAYVRLLDSAKVVMINLASLGEGRTPIVQGFEAGTGAPRQAGELSIAPSIAQASLDAAVYVVNPADDTVYFYMEGMNAPMGSYGAYGHAARAVAVVDRSLKELAPGLYGGKLRIPAAGRYDVAFLIDNPPVLHCFSAEVAPNPALRQERGVLAVDFLDSPSRARAGEPLALRFRLVDPTSRAPRAGLADVKVLSYLAPGQQRTETSPREVAPGEFELSVVPAREGAMYFHVVVPSLSLKPADLPFHSVIVEPAGRVTR
jgi:YVTN family beta-propeller protein